MRKRRRLGWTPVVGLIGALGAIPAGVSHASGAAPGPAGVASSVYAGTAPAVSRGQAVEPGFPATADPRPRGVRRIPPTAPAPAAPASTPTPTPTPTPFTGGSASLLASFNGVSSRDSAVTNFGAQFEPPDQGLCTGNGYVVEMVNSAYTVYRPSGTVITGPYNVNGPFDEGLTEFTSDPRCHYDASSHTWYATILYINPSNTTSRIDLAVNTSGDPTKAWTSYRIDTTDIGGVTGPRHPGCPCLGDQPTLGIDASNLYVTTNEFSLAGPQYNGAQIYAVPKSDLAHAGPPGPPAHFVHFDNLTVAGAIASSVQPALTTGPAPAEYFLSSVDPTGTSGKQIGVWAMTNRAGIATGTKPTLSRVALASKAYAVAPSAEQKGSASRLNAGDDRMQQVQYISGHIWGALGTAVKFTKDPTPRAGAAWFEVHPLLKNGVIAGATATQGYVAVAGNYLLYPAIQAAPDGKAVMVLSLSGARVYPSAAYSVMNAGAPAFGPVRVAAGGSGPYDPKATRWGDYSWAVLDPSGGAVWGATEYVPPRASQTANGLRNWGTRVFQVATP